MKKKMRKFADGGFTPAQEDWLGGADRTDPFILARMRAAVPDEKIKESVAEETSADLDPYGAADKNPAAFEKTVVKTKVSPSKKTAEKTVIQEEKKPYIDIPKDTSIGLRQFRSDGVSPMERLLKSITGSKSQRTMAAEKGMKKGGSVSSASKRADGIAQRGKTRGKMC
jgi:hypothetical protein